MKILLIVFLAISGIMAVRERRSQGGELVSIKDVSYLISVRQSNAHICNGALISLRHVLTASHCVLNADRLPLSGLSVVSGANDRFARGTRHVIKLIIYPTSYMSLIRYRDVAVLTLSKPASGGFFTTLKTIDVSTEEPDYMTVAKFFAFDTIPDKSGKHGLREILLMALPPERCVLPIPSEDIWPLVDKFCGKQERAQKLGITDLGGPLIQKGKIIGIASSIEKWDKSSAFPQFANAHGFTEFIDNAKKCKDSSCASPGCTVLPYDTAF